MKIGILIYPHVQPLDAIGPWEVFSIWQKILAPSVELVLVSEYAGLFFNCALFISISYCE